MTSGRPKRPHYFPGVGLEEACNLGQVMNTSVPWQRYRLCGVGYERFAYVKVCTVCKVGPGVLQGFISVRNHQTIIRLLVMI